MGFIYYLESKKFINIIRLIIVGMLKFYLINLYFARDSIR